MAFEVFQKSARGLRTRRHAVTLQKGGMLSISPSAAALLAGESPPDKLRVRLFFDLDKRMVGIELADNDDEDTFVLSRIKNGRSMLVTLIGFCRHYSIDVSRSRTYIAEREPNGLLVFRIDDPGAAV